MNENPYQPPQAVNEPEPPTKIVFRATRRLPPSSGPVEFIFRHGIVVVTVLLIVLFAAVGVWSAVQGNWNGVLGAGMLVLALSWIPPAILRADRKS